MLIVELRLAPATRAAWYRVGIRDTDHLRRPAVELLALPRITGSILHETTEQLHEHHFGLPAYAGASRIFASTTDDLEILRLRVVERSSLAEIAETFQLSRDGVRQRLPSRFGLSGHSPAPVKQRRRPHPLTIEDDRLRDNCCAPQAQIAPPTATDGFEDGCEPERTVREPWLSCRKD